HELRTPLTAIRGSLGLITGGAVGEVPQKVGELIKIAGNNTERLLMLINDILDVEKIEAGSMSFQFENLLLMPLIEQVLQDNAAYAEQFSVELVLMDRVEDARVTVDQGRLMQVMANLLSNAAKFSLENGKVEISINRLQDDKIRISVTDHGAGIPETFQPKLFDKFTQSDSSDTRQKGGTGLGLSITKAIVEKHNGQIGFKTRQGAGTTFYVDLPGQVVPKTAEELTEQQLHRPAILIIEDDADVAALLKIMLSEAGYNCDIAYCAAEARQLLSDREGDYKAITLDLLLPDEDGIELLQELRRKVATRDIPVVVVSAKADEARLELNGGAMGMADWLNKPIDESRLIDAIKQVTDPARKPRILHVEDDADVHTVVSYILRDS
ncbi:MAG: response regulator, partial [Gammaproteobacteria bacterium]|nr:response regulator [Gammaproteobacteria bacterium]